jgi:hypothetical protein
MCAPVMPRHVAFASQERRMQWLKKGLLSGWLNTLCQTAEREYGQELTLEVVKERSRFRKAVPSSDE